MPLPARRQIRPQRSERSVQLIRRPVIRPLVGQIHSRAVGAEGDAEAERVGDAIRVESPGLEALQPGG